MRSFKSIYTAGVKILNLVSFSYFTLRNVLKISELSYGQAYFENVKFNSTTTDYSVKAKYPQNSFYNSRAYELFTSSAVSRPLDVANAIATYSIMPSPLNLIAVTLIIGSSGYVYYFENQMAENFKQVIKLHSDTDLQCQNIDGQRIVDAISEAVARQDQALWPLYTLEQGAVLVNNLLSVSDKVYTYYSHTSTPITPIKPVVSDLFTTPPRRTLSTHELPPATPQSPILTKPLPRSPSSPTSFTPIQEEIADPVESLIALIGLFNPNYRMLLPSFVLLFRSPIYANYLEAREEYKISMEKHIISTAIKNCDIELQKYYHCEHMKEGAPIEALLDAIIAGLCSFDDSQLPLALNDSTEL